MITSVRDSFNHLAVAILVPVETSVNPARLFATGTGVHFSASSFNRYPEYSATHGIAEDLKGSEQILKIIAMLIATLCILVKTNC